MNMTSNEIEAFKLAAISIGNNISQASRPFFVAWCLSPMAVGDAVWVEICSQLGGVELSPEALLFAESYDAAELENWDRWEALSDELERRGCQQLADEGLTAGLLLAKLLPTLFGENHDF